MVVTCDMVELKYFMLPPFSEHRGLVKLNRMMYDLCGKTQQRELLN